MIDGEYLIERQEFFYKHIVVVGDCWLWRSAIDYKGYGKFVTRGKKYFAHRCSYLLHKGDIPSGLLVCHECDVRNCINPDHLWLGTNEDNRQDAISKGRMRVMKHPSISAYTSGCRCEDCKRVTSEYHKKRYQANNYEANKNIWSTE